MNSNPERIVCLLLNESGQVFWIRDVTNTLEMGQAERSQYSSAPRAQSLMPPPPVAVILPSIAAGDSLLAATEGGCRQLRGG
ncbi:hypothetical protein Y032_0001g408 [Ancylostoma ceylanicum]|uniref:Uncharacterized protein n=1 Tax=Ancylostoma ceylanicum TaxID=53326 RepID=A0A016W447_9BILA|nr:hypothetical protein Y032_0001g408 [Ancylostoma ceylanicum]